MPDFPPEANKTRTYITPTCNDVLCGRGNVPFHHVGNKKLRQKIAETLDSYIYCPSRQGRTAIIRETIRYIRVQQGGRFLKADKDGRWYDGGMKAAKSRVGTAFRDARVPNKVKCMKALKEEKPVNQVFSGSIQITSMTTTTSPAAPQSNSNLAIARRDLLSSHNSNRRRDSLGFGALYQALITEIQTENRKITPVTRTRSDSLASLPLSFKTSSKLASRRDSLSSLASILFSQTSRCSSKRESLDSCSTFGSYAPTITASRAGSLDSSISTIDSELLTGISMPEPYLVNSGADDSMTHFAIENSSSIAYPDLNMDPIDFGGRNVLDSTEWGIANQNTTARDSSNGEAKRVSSLPEDFCGKIISFAVAPSA